MGENYTATLKQGDLGPAIRAHIVNDSDRDSQDNTGAVGTFKLLGIDPSTGELVEVFEKSAVFENPTTTGGIIRYDWEAGDTDVTGLYRGLFKIVYASGTPEHYPDKGYIWITIESAGPNP